MKRALIFVYGACAYLLFFATLVYAMGFVANVIVPKGIDSGRVESLAIAMLVNSLMLGAFAIQHTIMARPAFKKWLAQFMPPAMERSTFVLVASGLLAVAFWQWKAMPGIVWTVENEAARMLLHGTYWLGWFLVLFSSFLINHFDLFGLRQVWMELRRQTYKPLVFRTTGLYKLVRHPLLLGFLLAFWSAPDMSEGRLLFAVLTTLYILVGIQFEERDLAATHEEYRRYRQEVPMLIPYKPPRPEPEPLKVS